MATETQQQNGQQAPRLPKLSVQAFDAVQQLDGFLARAPLSRQEHQQVTAVLGFLVQHLEKLEAAQGGIASPEALESLRQ
jgi:hypothetical protein